jgi:hypothetical protein
MFWAGSVVFVNSNNTKSILRKCISKATGMSIQVPPIHQESMWSSHYFGRRKDFLIPSRRRRRRFFFCIPTYDTGIIIYMSYVTHGGPSVSTFQRFQRQFGRKFRSSAKYFSHIQVHHYFIPEKESSSVYERTRYRFYV